MSDAIIITMIICATLVVLTYITNGKDDKKEHDNK